MPSLKAISASLVGLLSLGSASAIPPVNSEGETSPDGTLDVSKSQPENIPCFVKDAKKHNVKPLISIGGWTGSRHFSTNIGSAKNRTAFAKKVINFVDKYGFEGFDIDWEYPNRQGLGCNDINENDTANLLEFFKEIRKDPKGKKFYITAAGSVFPWNDKTGVASKDVSGFAEVINYIMLMNYDYYGAWSAVAGPNSPLYRKCDARNDQGAAENSIAQWTGAGMPASQLVLGAPNYGHGFKVNSTSAFGKSKNHKLQLYPAQNSTDRFQGSSWDNDPLVDACGNPNPPGGTYPFWSLIKEAKFLDTKGNPAPGIASAWDNCSQTPVLYDAKREIYVSYDNAASFYDKGKFVLKNKLAGFGTYEAGGDYNNILIDSIRSAVGLH
ncbi:hypothetical protein BFJ68_g10136 [Fusarium oxysporum]|uniref:chitinase n=1 Tax=Fusarium oxysporum TaxID=5507 RepID=A0A420QPP0_FUSOX|nr:hypothetical protein BFJ68_g10136 [Fusarium oxysporum]